MNALKITWFWLTRYMVAVEWEGQRKVHWSKTEADACEWMACYPDGTAMVGKRGRLIAARWM
jgi:hypothetical protein